jgi:hypothetical protein
MTAEMWGRLETCGRLSIGLPVENTAASALRLHSPLNKALPQ